ncbi:nucleoside deaminase [Desulfogranum marinum]|jgi:tRNA(adenine34) deaminase|uniref:nucleoside deaminase n=1 Tax=Desulfogranum marinum TaxID=453220 RepID=UPI0019658C1D|nr:nucleoside deaminase [Desulfogranum marinum]MBM9513556.1 nucleoside deaminase [Desulfogranum marinum]
MVLQNNHEKFMQEALKEARVALDEGEFPVGCVFVDRNRILARGRRRNSSEQFCNEIDHAEIVTLRAFLAEHPDYDFSSVVVYSTMEPCLMCYSTMLLSGIRSFVWAYEDIMGGGTNLPLQSLNALYAQMQITLVEKVQRTASLKLFQQFFSNYSYWQDSLLSRYTLEQVIEE